MNRLFALCAVLTIGLMPAMADAQTRPTLKSLQAENAKLKRSLTALQKRVARLSSVERRLSALERAAKPSSAGSGLGAVRSRLDKLESVVRINGGTVRIAAGSSLVLEGEGSVTLKGGGNVTVDGGGATTIKGAVVRLGGSGGKPVARVGDDIISSPVGGPGRILKGSATVFSR